MLPFFVLAAQSPTRQRAFRSMAAAHVAIVGLLAAAAANAPLIVGNTLLILGIVEGAMLLGWRLTQLPKSQALEFLLVSQLRPASVFLAEALVGATRLALITLTSLPVLVWLVLDGSLHSEDVLPLLAIPFLWGLVTGLGLVVWAYESERVRRWGERVLGALVLVYLVIGVLAAEHLPLWIAGLPDDLRLGFLDGFRALHEYNPFGVMRFAMEQNPAMAQERVRFAVTLGAVLSQVFLLRAASRLRPHFHDEHYRPVRLQSDRGRPAIGDAPLAWWAVRRVARYSGRINLWLAGGFSCLYAAYVIAGDDWPGWLGSHVFLSFERLGGVPVVTTALVVLAAVPAAFQYGVWDANVPERCRRLELLLLTGLDAASYWQASVRAAWQRGRGYFAVAAILWSAAMIAGRASAAQVAVSLGAGVLLWGLYFAIGFWAFTRGTQGAALGMLLTVGLPVLAILLANARLDWAMALTPPGSVFMPMTRSAGWTWLLGPVAAGCAALALARFSMATCDASLRRWYDLNHGARAMD